MVLYWTEEKVREEALKYKHRADFAKSCPAAVDAIYRRYRHLREDIYSHMTDKAKPQCQVKWTLELVTKEALLYSSKSGFAAGNMSAYNAMHKYYKDHIESICWHMPTRKVRDVKWTLEAIKTEALKYQTRVSFRSGSNSAYSMMNMFFVEYREEICEHMEKVHTPSDVVYVWVANGEEWNSKTICKIGITSASCGDARIKRVANYHGFTYDVIMYKVVDKPYEYEKELLNKFEVVSGLSGEGSTEFRAISDEDILALVKG